MTDFQTQYHQSQLDRAQLDQARPTVNPRTGPGRRLVRPRDNRWIAGVCSGLGRRLGISPNLVRVLFVLSCLLPGPQFLIYIMLWLIIPSE